MENIKKNTNYLQENNKNILGYKRFDPKKARKNLEEKFLEIEKIKSNKNEKLPNVKYAIEMLKISKSFNGGKIIANDEIDLLIAKNEVHAIIGENGAGKSTLMSILFGIYEPDEGSIKINEKTVKLLSAKDAVKYKLGMVHQHFKLIPTYTVFQNIILGSEDVIPWTGILRENIARKKLNAIIKKYDLGINLKDKVENLNVSQEQKVEILKLLYKDSDILIFDEPTAVLTPFEINHFLEIVKTLKARGKTIIIITHKFEEIKLVADRVTVIRRGRFISSFNITDKTIQEMAEAMVGRKIDEVKNNNNKYGLRTILEVKNLNIASEMNKANKSNKLINFSIKEGQIFAIAGVSGNGQTELALALSGLKKISGTKINLSNIDISKFSVSQRYKAGLSHVPEDRQKHGLILDMSCSINSVSNRIDDKEFSSWGFLNRYHIGEYSQKLFQKYDVRGTTSGTTLARSLSGGNQQKLIVARELSNKHKLIIMVQPTRGLDLGAIEYVHNRIIEEKIKGNAILLISYELSEILALADTVAVIRDGFFVDVSNIQNTSRQKIGELMLVKNKINASNDVQKVERG